MDIGLQGMQISGLVDISVVTLLVAMHELKKRVRIDCAPFLFSESFWLMLFAHVGM
jgi:hypothetical protein